MFIIKDGQLKMYDISEKYKNYLRKFDSKVSQKEERKFYGIRDYIFTFKKSTRRDVTKD